MITGSRAFVTELRSMTRNRRGRSSNSAVLPPGCVILMTWRARLVEVKPEPKVEVTYDRARHIIKITQPGGKTAEFDDRPVRFLVMDRNPVTKALEPVIIRGEPLYYYLAREVGGGK